MAAPIIPWQPSNLPGEVQAELNRRKINRSFKYVGNSKAGWDSKTGDWNSYRGPMVSWIRVCSNGFGDPKIAKPRFVLHSGKGYYQTYGFSNGVSTAGKTRYKQVIGYTPKGVEHTIDNSLSSPEDGANFPIHVPTPEISRLEVTVQKELFRRATIEWVCFSWKQLVYMAPYFLVPGMSVMIEHGWNHFNPISLVDLTNETESDPKSMQGLWNNAYSLYSDNILNSKGNYDVTYGVITNFNWSVEGNKIICSTEVTSKDRLYAGISKEIGLSSKSDDKKSTDGIYQSLKSFVDDKDTFKNIKTIAASSTPKTLLSETERLGNISNSSNKKWREIIRTILQESDPILQSIKISYLFGVFAGRDKEHYAKLGKPKKGDFDFTTGDTNDTTFWINMGLIIELINHFATSKLPGPNGKPPFKVDIINTVISGHANLISCDQRVLIPNAMAPKYHYGAKGSEVYGTTDKSSEWNTQYVKSIAVSSLNDKTADATLGRTMQQFGACYRNDLDRIININRYNNIPSNYPMRLWSFPSQEDAMLVTSSTGLSANKVEKTVSGLLSNIYISYDAFKSIVDNDKECASYPDIIKSILKLLNGASGDFWDLDLVEGVDGVMTITDKRYIGKYSTEKQGDTVFSFDYYDADSLIKSMKFRPQMTDAQAARAIYGETSNSGASVSYVDGNDLIDFEFKDLVFSGLKDAAKSVPSKEAARDEMGELIKSVQKINGQKDDGSLQLSVNSKDGPSGSTEIVKLVLPKKQILYLLLDDRDYDNNPRYCAIQPGITLELVIQGIGGIRTFQYFLVKNLPRPYSEKTIIFQVTDVAHTLESGNWETTIRAGLLPLRNYIKKRLPKEGGWQ